MGLPALLATIATAGATEPEFADSPALTSLWQATYSGNTDQLIDVLVQDHAFALQRSSDGRGPLFWAYEFKNVDAHALLTHLRADEEAEDLDGKRPAGAPAARSTVGRCGRCVDRAFALQREVDEGDPLLAQHLHDSGLSHRGGARLA